MLLLDVPSMVRLCSDAPLSYPHSARGTCDALAPAMENTVSKFSARRRAAPGSADCCAGQTSRAPRAAAAGAPAVVDMGRRGQNSRNARNVESICLSLRMYSPVTMSLRRHWLDLYGAFSHPCHFGCIPPAPAPSLRRYSEVNAVTSAVPSPPRVPRCGARSSLRARPPSPEARASPARAR